MFKACIPSVIRIWDFAFAETTAEAEHRLNPCGRPFAGFLCQPCHSGVVGLIHGQYPIKGFQICSVDLTCSAGQMDAAAIGRGLHPLVGSISNVPASCTRRINNELVVDPLLFEQMEKDTFRSG